MKKLTVNQFFKLKIGTTITQAHKRICGKLIGSGVYRDVYELKQNPDYVVKIERDVSKGHFTNVTEWRNWIDNEKWTWFSQWLAPCELINETGTILIQKRVNWDGKKKKDYPTHIPSMFCDLKRANFGWIGNEFVCCDYAHFDLPKNPNHGKYAKWWGEIPK